MKRHNFSSVLSWTVATVFASLATVLGAAPFDSATVTRVENKATVAEIKGGQAIGAHPAAVSDVVRANNFLQTASDARAELEFRDKSLVRVGPNTVFSFEARSRTLSLEKGEMLFYLPPGTGGVTIKTAAVTAALTGTVVLLTPFGIIVLEGKLTLIDKFGKKTTLEAGTDHNAATWANGRVTAYQSDGTDRRWFSLRRNLLTWHLPDNAEIKMARFSPWLKDGFPGSGDDGPFEGPGPGFGGGPSPVFGGGGGGGGEGNQTTRTNAGGSIGILDAPGQ